MVAGFAELAAWVEAGSKPGGDDWLDTTAVADPSFGCDYAAGPHLLATPCP